MIEKASTFFFNSYDRNFLAKKDENIQEKESNKFEIDLQKLKKVDDTKEDSGKAGILEMLLKRLIELQKAIAKTDDIHIKLSLQAEVVKILEQIQKLLEEMLANG